MTVADRWFYFAMVGLLGILGIVIQIIINKYKSFHNVLLFVGIIILLIFSVRTMIRNTDWIDNLTLFSHDSKINENFIIESNLAALYRSKHNMPEAITHYKRSVDLHPFEVNLYWLGVYNEALNDKQKAREYFYEILEMKGRNDELYREKLSASAWELLQYDTDSNVKDFINKALVKDPKNKYLWAYLATIDYGLGNKASALKNAEKAMQFSNDIRFNNLYNLIAEDKKLPVDLNLSPE
jgi:tetratricopeptide (TPR) repeat protein